mmetsp:Transcript_26282/g.84587  ORF Transcript_26282/g.84587 Transcript_26282/m.84587 type:complete len:214 (-) Transcript_26282:1585-2226(-)
MNAASSSTSPPSSLPKTPSCSCGSCISAGLRDVRLLALLRRLRVRVRASDSMPAMLIPRPSSACSARAAASVARSTSELRDCSGSPSAPAMADDERLARDGGTDCPRSCAHCAGPSGPEAGLGGDEGPPMLDVAEADADADASATARRAAEITAPSGMLMSAANTPERRGGGGRAKPELPRRAASTGPAAAAATPLWACAWVACCCCCSGGHH